ncbi:MAG: type II toxin-antitoxin system RelE/ParE family toxin [Pseudomonadota bacterium]
MKYRVLIPPTVAATVRHLHPALKQKIKEAMRLIEGNPFTGKPLRGKLLGLMSFRATHYRIVYRIVPQGRRIEVIDIGPRKAIYEKLFTNFGH